MADTSFNSGLPSGTPSNATRSIDVQGLGEVYYSPGLNYGDTPLN